VNAISTLTCATIIRYRILDVHNIRALQILAIIAMQMKRIFIANVQTITAEYCTTFDGAQNDQLTYKTVRLERVAGGGSGGSLENMADDEFMAV